jgi:peptide/nickel transport system substrate-binding protein
MTPLERLITRRQALATLAAGAAGVAVAACAPKLVPGSTSTTVKRGGTLKIGQNGVAPPAGGLDIQQQSLSGARDAVAPVYETLLNYDPTKADLTPGNLVPQLAKSWKVSSDGLTYTFDLYDGVKWQDGVPLTADDVVFSLERIINPPDGTVSPRQSIFSAVKAVAGSGNTVTITLSQVAQGMLGDLADVFTAIVPKHTVQQYGSLNNVAIGSGPFKLKSFEPNTSIELVKNPTYHFKEFPYLDGLTSFWIPDFTTLTDSFFSGQIDMTGTGTPLTAGQADIMRRERPQTKFYALHQLQYRYLAMSLKFKPFNDIRVRQAINEAIDRQALMDAQSDKGALCKGYLPLSEPQYQLPQNILSTLPGFGSDMNARRENARNLLAAAGFASGLNITLTCRPDLGYSESIAQAVPEQLAQVGITCKIQLMSQAQYSPLESASNIPFRAKNDSLRGLDPDDVLKLDFKTGGGRNDEDYSDPAVDALLAQQSITLDPTMRTSLVNQIQALVLTSSHRIPLWWPDGFVAVSPNVRGIVPQDLEDTAQLRYERVWLAS